MSPSSAPSSDVMHGGGAPGLVVPVSVVVPTYGRESVLVQTIEALLAMAPRAQEIIVVDQSPTHESSTDERLRSWNADAAIRWLRLPHPSIPAAMNQGLLSATTGIVLFVDDDIRPEPELAGAHWVGHEQGGCALIAGRVLQPWHDDGSTSMTGFAGLDRAVVSEFMGGNFSIRRVFAVEIGGFDERFVGAAYRFEAEFAHRVRSAGGTIRFEPRAVLHHLRASSGGTRAFGDHLRTVRPHHAVGEYYYLLRARPAGWSRRFASRPWVSVATRHHLRRPWWVGPTLVAELIGAFWALALWARGPKLVTTSTPWTS